MKIKLRQRIRNPEALEDAKRLVQAGADVEIVLVFLRQRGCDKADCIYAVENLCGKQSSEAKSLVIQSQAWSDRYETDTRLRDAALEAIRHLAADRSSDLPGIVFEENNDEK
jgi:predicted ATPase